MPYQRNHTTHFRRSQNARHACRNTQLPGTLSVVHGRPGTLRPGCMGEGTTEHKSLPSFPTPSSAAFTPPAVNPRDVYHSKKSKTMGAVSSKCHKHKQKCVSSQTKRTSINKKVEPKTNHISLSHAHSTQNRTRIRSPNPVTKRRHTLHQNDRQSEPPKALDKTLWDIDEHALPARHKRRQPSLSFPSPIDPNHRPETREYHKITLSLNPSIPRSLPPPAAPPGDATPRIRAL